MVAMVVLHPVQFSPPYLLCALYSYLFPALYTGRDLQEKEDWINAVGRAIVKHSRR